MELNIPKFATKTFTAERKNLNVLKSCVSDPTRSNEIHSISYDLIAYQNFLDIRHYWIRNRYQTPGYPIGSVLEFSKGIYDAFRNQVIGNLYYIFTYSRCIFTI